VNKHREFQVRPEAEWRSRMEPRLNAAYCFAELSKKARNRKEFSCFALLFLLNKLFKTLLISIV
ncbi:hypothetical protein, partial [Pediococcus cellicola]